MKRILFICALALSASISGAALVPAVAGQASVVAEIQPEASAEPLLVLVEADPWASVIGSDSPKLAVYDDGVVIYRKDDAYLSVRLREGELQAFLGSLRLEALGELAGSYNISDWTDQPTTDIILRVDGRFRRIWVYGSLARLALGNTEQLSAGADRLPPQILESYRRISEFERADAVAWSPDAIEVMIWPYEHAPDKSIVWPSSWPGLSDATTRRRGSGYSLFVPASERAELQSFLQGRQQRGAVLIDGQKWAASIRLPFPKEDRWMGVASD